MQEEIQGFERSLRSKIEERRARQQIPDPFQENVVFVGDSSRVSSEKRVSATNRLTPSRIF